MNTKCTDCGGPVPEGCEHIWGGQTVKTRRGKLSKTPYRRLCETCHHYEADRYHQELAALIAKQRGTKPPRQLKLVQ